jgi:hypothetical protein
LVFHVALIFNRSPLLVHYFAITFHGEVKHPLQSNGCSRVDESTISFIWNGCNGIGKALVMALVVALVVHLFFVGVVQFKGSTQHKGQHIGRFISSTSTWLMQWFMQWFMHSF